MCKNSDNNKFRIGQIVTSKATGRRGKIKIINGEKITIECEYMLYRVNGSDLLPVMPKEREKLEIMDRVYCAGLKDHGIILNRCDKFNNFFKVQFDSGVTYIFNDTALEKVSRGT